MITTLSVEGMTCGACSSAITNELLSLDGVEDASVSLITEEAVVHHDDSIKPEELRENIESCGFDARVISAIEDAMKPRLLTKLKISGMTCSNCSSSITNALQQLEGVIKAEVSLMTEEANVEHESSVSAETLKEEIEDCGFDAEIVSTGGTPRDDAVVTIISVKGMTCGACTSSVTSVLNEIPDVISADVSLVTEQASVKHLRSLDPLKLCEAIEDCGFESEVLETSSGKTLPLVETTRFDVDKTDNIDALNSIQGLISVELVNDKCVEITYDSSMTGVRDLIKVMHQEGISAIPQNILNVTSQIENLNKLKEIAFWRRNFIKTALVGFPIFIIYHILEPFGVNVSLELFHGLYLESVIQLIACTYIQFTVGVFFWRNAVNSFKHGSGTMDTLVCISTNISYYFSIFTMILGVINNETESSPHTLFETAVLLMNFVSLGKWLESRAKSETSSALSRLISLTSTDCVIVENPEKFDAETGVAGKTISIPTNYLQINDIVDVKPGEKIPADGYILFGSSEVDESLLTGESVPVPKDVNDNVIGGSINGVGHIYVKVSTTSENSQLAKIIKLVKSAQMSRAPIQSYADYVASIFVPTILILSVVTFITWFILCDVLTNKPKIFNDVNGQLYICMKIAISVIVVACPCALGLAAPTAIMVGTGVGASNGILLKGGDVIEIANDIDVVLFDKTGTLTLGKMTVRQINLLGELDRNLVLRLIGALESKSEHPIGHAITANSMSALNVDSFEEEVQNFEVKVGQGLKANVSVNGVEYDVQVGNLKLFPKDILASDPIFSSLEINSDATLAHVMINNKYEGYLELQDVIKEDSASVVTYLKKKGFEVAMVTGDLQKAANKIAQQAGIPLRNVFAEISPAGKEQLVRDFKDKGYKVAFVGDGINDSPALASADLGIAIASGSDIAIEAADIVVLNNHTKLAGVASALSLSVRTLKKIKWNFFWSSVYNLTMVPLAMGVLIPWGVQVSPLVAGLSMALSSVSVVISSLFLKRWKAPDISKYGLTDDDEVFDVESGARKDSRKPSLIDRLRGLYRKNRAQSDVELNEHLMQ
ncbi:CCC2 [Cyberlindnera jadinii]|uniref:P-type Cu(+) transporter n=1 Tax=Cyberlindnera jadinii (strain ATCC 18201 / CBS 1600 / BCRC 20928 / JCM 3617 / NBRC 0987 / NRRL Y-1542) TaxID=983966 RepID=A0A0H5C992_CYBJN|nr:CCC2 [Cyberlindnera jadinii]